MAKINIVIILLSLATNYDKTLQQFDVKNAFLHSNLEDETYMDTPPMFNKKFTTNHIFKLKKALYRLKQLSKLALESSPRP